jgi:predicted adenylyl cyclase CyaB
VADPIGLRAQVEALATSAPVVLRQEDTFYHCPSGRLKLRVLSDVEGELIFYDRPNTDGPKTCEYLICPTTEPRNLASILGATMKIRGVVRKKRLLYMVGRTRVHIDEVDGLGSFLELEVVLQPDESMSSGEREAQELMRSLGIRKVDLVSVAYIDLLEDGVL